MSDATVAADAVGALELMESTRPLRDSSLWDLQSAYYKGAGMACWSDAVVPHFVTSNAFFAASYAKVLLAYIKDWFA
jgi:hypothetical protein